MSFGLSNCNKKVEIAQTFELMARDVVNGSVTTNQWIIFIRHLMIFLWSQYVHKNTFVRADGKRNIRRGRVLIVYRVFLFIIYPKLWYSIMIIRVYTPASGLLHHVVSYVKFRTRITWLKYDYEERVLMPYGSVNGYVRKNVQTTRGQQKNATRVRVR